MPIVTAYDSLGEEGLRHSLKQTGSKAIFLDPNLISTLLKVLGDAPSIQSIIYNDNDEVKSADVEKLRAAREGMKVLSFDELQKTGADSPVDPTPLARTTWLALCTPLAPLAHRRVF